MSVQFAIARRQDDGSLVHGCRADHRRAHDAATCPDIENWEHYRYCECVEAAQHTCSECTTVVEVSNANAQLILDRLGIEFDHCGVLDPDDLLGRALTGNVGRDDSGVTPVESAGEFGTRVIDCGLRPGYFENRLAGLADLAEYAKANGLLVGWA